MSLRKRLVLTLVAITLLMALPALYAATQLVQLSRIMNVAQRNHGEAYLAMGRLQARLSEFDRLQRSYIITRNQESRAAKDSAIALARAHLRTLEERGYRPVAAPALRTVREIQAQSRAIDALIESGRTDEATEEFERVKPLLARANERMRRIADEIDARSATHLRRATVISAAAYTTTLLALGVAVFLALALGAWITRNLIAPITQLRKSMAQVAGGDFHVPDHLPYERGDEIGHVSRSFRGMTARLEELDKLKADFMSISTHELKTPINVISGYAELMHEGLFGEVTDKQAEALSSIREQTRVLTVMVNQLLDVSRIEAGGLRLEMQDVVMRDLFDRIERTFQALARKQDVRFEVVLDEDAAAVIPGDADRLRDQVLGNMISNALKFTPDGGTVTVRGQCEGEWMKIEVEDNGTGIPPDQLPHIFDKYYQVGEQARSTGAGLGLAIAKDVVSGHGGEITVDSTPGVGTCFRVLLPTTRDHAERSRSVHRSRRTEAAAAAEES